MLDGGALTSRDTAIYRKLAGRVHGTVPVPVSEDGHVAGFKHILSPDAPGRARLDSIKSVIPKYNDGTRCTRRICAKRWWINHPGRAAGATRCLETAARCDGVFWAFAGGEHGSDLPSLPGGRKQGPVGPPRNCSFFRLRLASSNSRNNASNLFCSAHFPGATGPRPLARLGFDTNLTSVLIGYSLDDCEADSRGAVVSRFCNLRLPALGPGGQSGAISQLGRLVTSRQNRNRPSAGRVALSPVASNLRRNSSNEPRRLERLQLCLDLGNVLRSQICVTLCGS
jgi:hypothetical protein